MTQPSTHPARIYAWPKTRPAPPCGMVIDVTTHGTAFRALSPMLLGPCQHSDGTVSLNMENLWQYSKVYPNHHNQQTNEPNEHYFKWRNHGFTKKRADRHPMGYQKPLYSWWHDQQLHYTEARRLIYIPVYRELVIKTPEWNALQQIWEQCQQKGQSLYLLDFDAYDHHHVHQSSLKRVWKDETRKMGHAFCLIDLLLKHTQKNHE